MKTRTFQRPLSLVAVLILVLSLFPAVPFPAFAADILSEPAPYTGTPATAFTTGNGSESSPYEICTAEELYLFAKLVNGGKTGIHGILMADILVNRQVLDSYGNLRSNSTTFFSWTPIGSENKAYTGTFDGNGKTISGLCLDQSSTCYVGLFGYVSTGTVKNVGVIDSYFYSSDYTGGVVGRLDSGTVTNCYHLGTVSADISFFGEMAGYIGGVVGSLGSGKVSNCYQIGSSSGFTCIGGVVGLVETGTVANCYQDGYVDGCYNVGGVVGEVKSGTVTDCYKTGYTYATTDSSENTGGVVGYNKGVVKRCYKSGYVEGLVCTGGVVGVNYGTVENCYNLGQVEGDQYTGGVAGRSYSTVANCFSKGKLINSTDGGGVIGAKSNGTVTNCYYLKSDSSGSYIDSEVEGSMYYGIGNQDVAGSAEARTEEQLASGEVAYALQSAQPEQEVFDDAGNSLGTQVPQVWGQTIGTHTTPILGGSQVYLIVNCKGTSTYSNVEGDGHRYENGICTICGAAEPSAVTIPSLTASNVSLSFEDEVLINVYFTATDTQDVVNYGLLTFAERLDNPSHADAIGKTTGYFDNNGSYRVSSPGIPAKNMSENVYFAVYAELADGTYAYSKVYYYAPATYAYNMLGKDTTSAKMKQLIVAMLNYGAAAQIFFDYNTDNLVNASLTAEQQAYVDSYNADMLDPITYAKDSKKGELFGNGNTGFQERSPSVSFEGAFSINFYLKPNDSVTVDGDVDFYYWDAETYASVDTLLPSNAVSASKCELVNGMYRGVVTGISAKEVDETVYVAAIYTGTDGNTYVSGVIAYSLGYYLENQATGTMAELSQATGVYAYYAKNLFNT